MAADHCTFWFEGAWGHCCEAHDAAYAAGVDRLLADLALEACVRETGHSGMAAIMFAAVSAFGWIAYKLATMRRNANHRRAS